VTLGYLPANDASFEILHAVNLVSCNFPTQITANFNGTDYTFDVICNGKSLLLNGPGATLNTPNFGVEQLKIYPNPTNGKVTLKLNKNISEIDIEISNILGQVISNERFINTNTINLNIVGSPGIYFVSIKTSEGNSKIIKVLKK
jgi:hypothetical protein